MASTDGLQVPVSQGRDDLAAQSPSPENDIFSIEVPIREPKAAATTSLSFNGLLEEPLSVYEDLQKGCGGQLWPAGMVLAKYMLSQHRGRLSHKSIVEIGAGAGLVGLAVAKGCEIDIPLLITDQQPMLALMQKNVSLNQLEKKVTVHLYDWGAPPSTLQSWCTSSGDPLTHPDIVLAADCVYFEPAFPLLIQTLQDLIGRDTICYFCFKKRRKADWRFIKEMQKKFDTSLVDYEDREKDQRSAIYLYRVIKKSP